MIVLLQADDGHRLFALAGDRLAIGRVGQEILAAELCDALRSFYVEGEGEGLLPEITGPERVLARRWFQAQDRAGSVLKMVDFPTYASVAETILHLANEEGGATAQIACPASGRSPSAIQAGTAPDDRP